MFQICSKIMQCLSTYNLPPCWSQRFGCSNHQPPSFGKPKTTEWAPGRILVLPCSSLRMIQKVEVSHEKNPQILSIESWSVNRDPYNGL